MTNSVLDSRKHAVLEAIVDCYNRTAEPVSSQKIVRDYDMGLSAATLRNTMADLEELGYLTHPHTSAGRVPTEQGYRVYVDSLMIDQKLSRKERQFIQDGYASSRRDFEEIMEQTSKILSAISHHIGVVLSPELHESILHRLELISIDSEHILAVLLMASGAVKNQVVSIPKDLSDGELYQINRILNVSRDAVETDTADFTGSCKTESCFRSPPVRPDSSCHTEYFCARAGNSCLHRWYFQLLQSS